MSAEETPRRALINVAIAANLSLAIGFAINLARNWLTPTGVVASDFSVFWTGWWLILHGQGPSLYDATAQRAAQHLVMGRFDFQGGLMAFLYPPHAALLGVPLGALADRAGESVAFAVWTLIDVLLLARLDRLLRETLAVTGGRTRWLVTSSLCGFYPVFAVFMLGQVSLLLAVACVELQRSLERERPGRGAAWLVVLSIKPQLAAPVALFLMARRRWAILARAALLAAVVAGLTALFLGPSIWIDYIRHMRGLESFFGTGTPAYMMNLRGALTRLFGPSSAEAIGAASVAAWLAAMAALVLALRRRRPDGPDQVARQRSDERSDFALTLAVALLFSPHLFVQDAVLWAPALALEIAARRARGVPWVSFATFAASWPLLIGVGRMVDLGAGKGVSLRVDPAVVAMVIALGAMARVRFARAASAD